MKKSSKKFNNKNNSRGQIKNKSDESCSEKETKFEQMQIDDGDQEYSDKSRPNRSDSTSRDQERKYHDKQYNKNVTEDRKKSSPDFGKYNIQYRDRERVDNFPGKSRPSRSRDRERTYHDKQSNKNVTEDRKKSGPDFGKYNIQYRDRKRVDNFPDKSRPSRSDSRSRDRERKYHDKQYNKNVTEDRKKSSSDFDKYNTQYRDRKRTDNFPNTRRSEPYKRNLPENESKSQKRFTLNWRDKSSRNNEDTSYAEKQSSRESKFFKSESENHEFEMYEEAFKQSRDTEFIKTREIEKDLFLMDKEYCLAHCVAEDMNMGSGIAVRFRYDFKRVDELLNQRQKTGGLALLKIDERYIYYLVTKRYSTGKPTYKTLFSSLLKMRTHVIDNCVKKIAMPRIGCGLDRLQWENVKFMIEFVFRDVDVDIVICNLQMDEDLSSPQQRHKNCRLTNVTYPIHKIEEGTIIIYFSSEDEFVSEEMKLLDEKFHFLQEFRVARKQMGNVIFYSKNPNFLLCGCIVKKFKNDHFDFRALQTSLQKIQRENKKLKFEYIAFQAFKDNDSTLNYKIINIMRNSFRDVEVYVCWPDELQNLLTPKDKFSLQSNQGTSTAQDNSQDWNKSYNDSEDWNKSYNDSEDFNKSYNDSEDWNKSYNDDSFNQSTSQASADTSTTDWFNQSGDQTQINNISVQSSSSSWAESSWINNPRDVSEPDVIPSSQFTVESSDWDDDETSINHEYELFQKEEHDTVKFSVVKEKNVASDPGRKDSLAYLVTEDMDVDSDFQQRNNFGNALGQLLSQNQKEGNCAYVKRDSNFIYCVILRQFKSTIFSPETMFSALQQMKEHAARNFVKRIIFPKMNFVFKTFEKNQFKYMLEFLFKNVGTEIILLSEENKKKEISKSRIGHTKSALFQQTKKKTIIIYFCDESGRETEEMKALNKAFPFLETFRKTHKCIGKIIPYEPNSGDVILYGCVIYKDDAIDFVALQECVSKINEENKRKNKFSAASIQAVKDSNNCINFKIINVLLSNLEEVGIKVCWPGDLARQMPSGK